MTPPHIRQSTLEILSLCKSGHLSGAVALLNSINPSATPNKPLLYASLLQTATKLRSFLPHGQPLHCHLIKSGLHSDRFVGNSLLSLYFKLSPNFSLTKTLFDGLSVKDVVSWTSMITGFLRAREPRRAVALYKQMAGERVDPNGFTLSAAVKACAELGEVGMGRAFHGVVFRRGFDGNVVIASALIDMYGRSGGGVGDAEKVFDEMLDLDSVCWTSLISAFTRNDLYKEALGMFCLVGRNGGGLVPDGFTFGSVLMACGNLWRLRQGREVHGRVVLGGGGVGNVVVESSLVDMYAKCGALVESRLVFDRMRKKNAVSCSALLNGYCLKGEYKTVIELFREMEEVDLYSFGTILRSCAALVAVRQGKEVHSQYLRRGGWRDVVVESALVDLYAKCGCVGFAYTIFEEMPVRNLVTWNSMIFGLAQNGRGREAVDLLKEMINEGIDPDYITYIGVLFACSHTGLVDEGRKYFISMTEKYGIKAGVEHYTCMVDLLGRADQIEEAEDLLMKSDVKNDSSLWASLLGACTTSRNSTAAERVAKKMMELEPDLHLSYVLLANVYRDVGRWSDADEIRKLMQDRGVKKIMPGKSWIDVHGSLNSYLRNGNAEIPI